MQKKINKETKMILAQTVFNNVRLADVSEKEAF